MVSDLYNIYVRMYVYVYLYVNLCVCVYMYVCTLRSFAMEINDGAVKMKINRVDHHDL